MTQNIYDDEAFFAAYSRLPRSAGGLDDAPEWPTLRALLPALAGTDVLDLGCGFGWFCRFAGEQGAARVVGVDVSERMLARAQTETQNAAISYLRADLERFAPKPRAFDLVYSSLAFHYIEDLASLFGRIHAALKPEGALVFSVEHPLLTAAPNLGWQSDADGKKIWPLRDYLDEGPRAANWLVDGVIKQHRTVETYVTLLLAAGFTLTRLVEWSPSVEQVAAHPEWAHERARPFFLLIRVNASGADQYPLRTTMPLVPRGQ